LHLKVDALSASSSHLARHGDIATPDIAQGEWTRGGGRIGGDQHSEQVGPPVLVLQRDDEPQVAHHKGSVSPAPHSDPCRRYRIICMRRARRVVLARGTTDIGVLPLG
jgi:hypothetical protein